MSMRASQVAAHVTDIIRAWLYKYHLYNAYCWYLLLLRNYDPSNVSDKDKGMTSIIKRERRRTRNKKRRWTTERRKI